MPTVVNIKSVDSGLQAGRGPVHTIELADAPFSQGNFGEVYEAVSINGVAPSPPQVVKILFDDGCGAARKGVEAIQKLQGKIREHNRKRAAAQRPALESLPALAALPQFSFCGEIDGKPALGYSANRLDTEGYLPFSVILDSDPELERYSRLSLEERLLLASELAEGFQALSEMDFIHADINAPNLLIDIAGCHLAIIDYDSGAVMDNPDDRPTTFGKRDEWLAPEIADQMSESSADGIRVKVDRFTDAWSVFIGIHYLLFLYYPFFFFSGSVNRETVGAYLAGYRWPDIAVTDPQFNPVAEPVYPAYRALWDELSEPLAAMLQGTLNEGYFDPHRRASYQQWVLKLRDAQRAPEIVYFGADKESVISGTRTRLSWLVTGANRVSIDNEIGAVAPDSSREISPPDTRWYELTAHARNGKSVSRCVSVRVWPVPILRSLAVPTCRIQQQVTLRNFRLLPPRIRLPATLNLKIRIGEPALKWMVTDHPAAVSLPRLGPALGRKRIAALFDQMKSAISQLISS